MAGAGRPWPRPRAGRVEGRGGLAQRPGCAANTHRQPTVGDHQLRHGGPDDSPVVGVSERFVVGHELGQAGAINVRGDLGPHHPTIVVPPFPGKYANVYNPLWGYKDFEGAALQMNKDGSDTHSGTIKWLDRSAKAGRKWNVCHDEYGHGANGVKPDSTHYAHDEPRKNCLWGNLMAGGSGVEWYFG